MNPLLRRFYLQNSPIEKLSREQMFALERFRSKLAQGVYQFEDVPCLCGSTKGKLVAQRDRYALPVRTHLCKLCGIMWTSPRMIEASLKQFYEDDYRPIYVGTQSATENFFEEQVQHGCKVYDFVSPFIKHDQHPIVFDVGCGAGGMLIPFVEASWSAFGCDLEAEYLERGRNAGLILVQGDVSVLREYGPANLVILSHVLEHLKNPLGSIIQIARSITVEGYVYIELPGIFSIHRTYGDIMLFLQNAHLYHFTLKTLSSLMSKAGFRLIKGDEGIRALFQRDSTVKPVLTTREYQQVLKYLYFVEIERLCSQNSSVRYIRHLAMRFSRHVLGDDRVNSVKAKLGWPQL